MFRFFGVFVLLLRNRVVCEFRELLCIVVVFCGNFVGCLYVWCVSLSVAILLVEREFAGCVQCSVGVREIIFTMIRTFALLCGVVWCGESG